MAKIVISGYYGFNNIGDESILTSIVNNLKQAIPNVDITVLSVNPQSTEKKHGVKAINRKNAMQILQEIKNCDLLISGGGSLLQDVTSGKSISYYLGVIMMGLMMKKRVMIYSQGIGPVNRSYNRMLVKYVLNKVDCITVRDEKSKDELLNIGVNIPPVFITADPVIGLDKVPLELGRTQLIKEGLEADNGKPIIGFAIRGWKKNDRLKSVLAKTADRLIEKLDVQVVFVPFHYGEDIRFMEEIEEEMNQKAVFVKHKYDVQEMLGITGNFDLLIGVRLHSLIFAAIMNVPMIGISYDPKNDSFMASLEQKCLCEVEELALEDLLIDIEAKWANLQGEKEILKKCVIQLKDKLALNEKLVRDLLAGEVIR
ncbi:MAG: polysaccharide pyruvyl transferase [Anaerosolibacter sp.]|jgi:polysaccharide pyruvyl transferase CsaB|uniref:polysaccharide pyruvyl transferase CsaB n=1 Tax=Anaerosolibacter sp. TaxID=1872527 RepID=UPI00263892AA|nr:polysaccharide pyruvyl transferase CsaB [Anaerosolibacter sp.]MDF2548728.1 polysaccharide pyruvyl transferase [Anaerosolibacter sp.]